MTDLLMQTDGRVEAIWYCPPTDPRKAILLIRAPGCTKRYRRIFLDDVPGVDQNLVDDTWFKPDDAILIAGEDDD